MDRAEVKELRSNILVNTYNHTKVLKGNKRIKTLKVCSVCGRNLTAKDSKTGKTIVICSYFNCKASKDLSLNLCLDSHSCYSRA